MEKYIIVVVVVIGIWVAYNLYIKYRTNNITNNLINYLATGDVENFENLVSSKTARNYIHPFNLYFLKLNAAIMKGKKAEIKEAFYSFDQLRLSKQQKKMVYEKGFYLYLSQQDKKETKKYYDLLIDLGNSDNEILSCFYDTYLLGGSKYLNNILSRLEETPLEKKPAYAALISDMYKNRADKENCEKYEKLAAEYYEALNSNSIR
jgi:hypothetical protein